jgi:hypothetical protein
MRIVHDGQLARCQNGVAAGPAASRPSQGECTRGTADNDPYKIQFGQGDWTCTVAQFTGHMDGSMRQPDGTEIPATNKPFELDFYTIAHWVNGEIVEERLMNDLVGFMRQIGLG